MNRDDVINILKETIKHLEKFPSSSKFYTPGKIEELPHCPDCHRYIGDGFESSGFMYLQEKCICGYRYSE